MRRAAPRVLLLMAAVLVPCVLAVLAAPVTWTPLSLGLPEAALLAAFVATELWVVHLSTGRHSRTLSMSEVPLVLGLVLVGPVALLVCRLLSPVLVHALPRRIPPLRAAVNVLLSLAETLAALAVFSVVAGPASAPGPRVWAAGYLAAVVTALLSHAVILTAMALSEGSRPDLRQLGQSAAAPVGTAAVTTTLALVALHALHDDPRSLVLLLAVSVAVLLLYRGYAAFVDRHGALERLHAFSRAVSVQRQPDDVLRSVLEQARALLQTEYAAVQLGGEDGVLVVELDGDAPLRRRPAVGVDDREGLLSAVLGSGRPLLLVRDERDPRRVSHLRLTGRRDLVAVPLPGEHGPLGLLLAGDRQGSAGRTLVADDVRLLETVAHHAGAALQSGRLLARLQHDAHHDALTGLANRTGLLDAAAAALRPGTVVALVLLDLDGFRQVNDGLGHAAGDALLCSTAERLRSVLPDGALAARLGGDEFAVLLPDAGDGGAALGVAREVRRALAAPMTVHGVTLAVGASAGLAVRDGGDPGTADELLSQADLALAAARADGDLDVRVAAEAAGAGGAERLTLAADLRTAVEDGALSVHVQPKADLVDGRVVGVEALARWTHPELGPVFPDVFIPLAERSGLIVPLTSFVLRTAVEAAAGWHRDGEELHVAVNLSPRSLGDDLVVDEVLALLDETGLPPHLLTLEVTEGSVIAEPERAERLLRRLRDAGVRLSLDDFGTGYSSLTHLKRLPVHEVKIDRSFVRDLAHDDDDAAIVRSIVDLGMNLRLEVVAEGVEDDEAWQLLAGLGCDLAQGYHLSRPMPLAEFPGWLRAQRTAVPVLPLPRADQDAVEVVR